MSIPNARVTNPSPKERLSIGLWSAKSGLERAKITSAWTAFLISSAGVVVVPAFLFWNGTIGAAIASTFFGLIALVILFELWRSKRSIGAKLANSVFLCLPILGVTFYHILNAPDAHGENSNSYTPNGYLL